MVGIYLIVILPLQELRKWNRTYYLITNQRVVVLKGKAKQTFFDAKKIKIIKPTDKESVENKGLLVVKAWVEGKDETFQLAIENQLPRIVEILKELEK